MSVRRILFVLSAYVLVLTTGCGGEESTATLARLAATATPTPPESTAAALPTATPLPPTDTPLPPPTAAPVPPTAVPSATPKPAPLLSLESSPQPFGRSQTFQVGLGDVDGDGDLDAVFANMAANDSQVWFNDGMGQFTDSGQRLTQQGHGLGLGDLDDDGDLDIFMTCAHYGGGGGWSKKPSRHLAMWPSLGDLDGDGDLDVVEAGFQGKAEVWLNRTAYPTPEGGGGLIAFVSTRDGNGEIYVMNADGSDQRRLTNYRQWDGFPDWSPDGKQIAYYSYLSDKNWVIKVMDADGSNPRQLTDSGVCDGAPHWSPDGTRITYDSGDCTGDHREIYVVSVDGGTPVNLSNHAADDMLAAWSPDSTQLVFSSNRDGNYEIYVMDADGGNVRRLTENADDDHAPAWSPDGSQIVFYSNRDGNEEIYVMDVADALQGTDGGNPRNLTNNPTEDWFPRWSPDGSQITFSSKRGGNLDIYVMDVADALQGTDGGNVRRLTDSRREDFNSVWQPRLVNAQVDTWVRSYAKDPRWAALDGLVTGDGGYLLVGASNYSHKNTRREDIYLVKTDAAGEIVWGRAHGGDDFDRGNAVIEAGGGFVILGETASTGAGDWDFYLLQVDQDGDEIWSRTFGGPGRERANAIRHTADGGYILVGQTSSFGAGDADLYLVKTDDQGGEIWSRTYGGEHDEEGYAVQQTPDGGHVLLPTSDGAYLIAGITTPAGNQSKIDVLFVKIDTEGNQIWNKPLGDQNAVDYGTDALELPGGGYLLTGMYNRSGRGAIPLIRTDADGEPVWTRNLVEGRGNKAAMRLLPTPDGGYLIVGNTDEFGGVFKTILIKTDRDGNVAE